MLPCHINIIYKISFLTSVCDLIPNACITEFYNQHYSIYFNNINMYIFFLRLTHLFQFLVKYEK